MNILLLKINFMLHNIKHFFLSSEHDSRFDYVGSAILLAVSQIPFMGAIVEGVALITGAVVLIKAIMGTYNTYLDKKIKQEQLKKYKHNAES